MPLKDRLVEILKTQDFHRLNEFEDFELWKNLKQDERELLGLLFVMQGEKYLREGDQRVLESFKNANLVAPGCIRVMFRQALAFAKQASNIFCLKAANKIYESIIQLNPEMHRVWHSWGNTGLLIAIHSQREEHFLQALSRFDKAVELADRKSKKSIAEVYRDKGMLWLHYGKMTGEPCEFVQSIQCYEKAISLGMNSYDLWNEYGNALIDLAALNGAPHLILEGVRKFWQSVRIKTDFFEGWINLSTALKELYQMTSQEAYFSIANKGFEKASKLDPDNLMVWVKWGQLLAFKGKRFKEIDLLKESCEKFQTADLYESHHPVILSSWAESLLFLGELNEDLNLLHEAESKALQSLQKHRDNPRIWCLYGNCLAEIGRYFEDESYYIRAIEKYELAQKIAPEDPVIWHRLGLAYMHIGLLRQDCKLLDKAGQCCKAAIKSGAKHQADIWNDWGYILLKLGIMTDQCEVVEEAISRFEQALMIALQNGNDYAIESQLWYNYGCALDFLGDYHNDESFLERAINVFNKVVETDPFFHHTYFNLALTTSHFAELNSSPEGYIQSLKYLETYTSFEPEDEEAWIEWGITLIDYAQLIDEPVRKGEFERLLKDAEEKFFYARNLGCSLAYYHLGSLYSLMEHTETALECLYKAKEIGVLPSQDELLSNPWLESIRNTNEFKRLIFE